MRFAYRTNGLPRVGSGAFLPLYAQTPQGVSAGALRTTALMGTRPVPSPRPPAMQDAWWNNQPSEGMDLRPPAQPPTEVMFRAAGVPTGVQAGYGTGAFRPAKMRPAGGDVLYPWGGISHVDGCYPPMAIYSDNVMPVPAMDSTRLAQVMMRAVRQGGVRVTRNPRAFPRWPTYGGGVA